MGGDSNCVPLAGLTFGESSPAFFIPCHNFVSMCGRYRLSRRKQIIAEYFDAISDPEDWIPRYNVAPTQPVPVIRQNPTEPIRHLSQMRWGLIPSWSKDASGAASMINARSETAGTLPSFRDAMKYRRCLGASRCVLRMVATRSCMCDCPASTTRPVLPSHWQYPTRYGDSVTNRLEALGQCIPPSQDGYRNREGTILLPASRRIGARVSGRVSGCEPL